MAHYWLPETTIAVAPKSSVRSSDAVNTFNGPKIKLLQTFNDLIISHWSASRSSIRTGTTGLEEETGLFCYRWQKPVYQLMMMLEK